MSKTKKLLIAAVCLVAILTSAVVGTIAWLTDKTATVTNTFSPSNINITLTETKGTGSSETAKDFKMVPGTTIDKDPVVTVKANSEACWLFVKIDESANFGDFMTYAIADGWTKLTTVQGVSGVFYRKVDASSTADQSFGILGEGTLTVNSITCTWDTDEVLVLPTVTKTAMNALTEANYPTLTFTAYAIQQAGIENDASVAWAAASAQATP